MLDGFKGFYYYESRFFLNQYTHRSMISYRLASSIMGIFHSALSDSASSIKNSLFDFHLYSSDLIASGHGFVTTMSHDQLSGNTRLPAPCIVDTGIVVNKQDMQRLLTDLSRVRYSYTQDGNLISENEGYVLEVFSDPQRSTLVANHTLYLNVQSFDFLELKQSPEQEAWFDLIQDNRQLRLIPLSNPLQDQTTRSLNAAALEAVVAEVLSASWDMRIDDEENFSI